MITFQIPDLVQPAVASHGLRLTLLDTQDMAMRTLSGGPDGEGLYTIRWDGCDQLGLPVTSGVYVLKLETPLFSQSRKIIVLR